MRQDVAHLLTNSDLITAVQIARAGFICICG